MLNFWPNIAIFQLYRNYVVSPSEPDLLFFYSTLHCPPPPLPFFFFSLRNHITNDMHVGYYMAVMQEGKELKCINEQKSLGTSISLPRHFLFCFQHNGMQGKFILKSQ